MIQKEYYMTSMRIGETLEYRALERDSIAEKEALGINPKFKNKVISAEVQLAPPDVLVFGWMRIFDGKHETVFLPVLQSEVRDLDKLERILYV